MQAIINNITNTDSFLESLKAFGSSFSFSTIIMLIMVFFMIVGAIDKIRGNKKGYGAAFDEGFNAMGPLAIAMVGAIAAAPVLIVPCFRTDGPLPAGYNDINMSAATENMLLEITSLGLGACWIGISPRPERMDYVDEVLGTGKKLRSFAIIALGYPAEDRPQQDRFDATRIHYL